MCTFSVLRVFTSHVLPLAADVFLYYRGGKNKILFTIICLETVFIMTPVKLQVLPTVNIASFIFTHPVCLQLR